MLENSFLGGQLIDKGLYPDIKTEGFKIGKEVKETSKEICSAILEEFKESEPYESVSKLIHKLYGVDSGINIKCKS